MYVSDIVNSSFHHLLPHQVPEVIINNHLPPPQHVVDVDQYIINVYPTAENVVVVNPINIDHVVDAIV